MIMKMEEKFNYKIFKRRFRTQEKFCRLAHTQYWNWLIYLDDDYLSEWEVLKMKQLFQYQIGDLIYSFFGMALAGYLISFPVMGFKVRSRGLFWYWQLPTAWIITLFLGIQY